MYPAIDEDFIKEYQDSVVWLRDDYLCMRGISHDVELIKFLDSIEELKEKMRQEGHVFTC